MSIRDSSLNSQVSAFAATHVSRYGLGRGDVRTHILPKLGLYQEITITKNDKCWIADAAIGNEILHAVYGDFEINSGYTFKDDFYR